MMSFAMGQYQEMSSIWDCPLRSFYFGTKKGLLNFKEKNLDLEEKMSKLVIMKTLCARLPSPVTNGPAAHGSRCAWWRVLAGNRSEPCWRLRAVGRE